MEKRYYVNEIDNTATTVTLSASAEDTSVSVYWFGIIQYGNSDTTCTPLDEKWYSETIYIGENTDCNENKKISGTIEWYSCEITYHIIQSKAICETCDDISATCRVVESYVDPYMMEPSRAHSSTTLYYEIEYTSGTTCSQNTSILYGSTTIHNINVNKLCSDPNRTIPLSTSVTIGDDTVLLNSSCYVRKPDNCCEGEDATVYRIGEISYVPEIVPYSGGNVTFSFDYEKIDSIKCKETKSYGNYSGNWNIGSCSDDTELEKPCCYPKTITSAISLFNDSVIVNLSIQRDKDPNATDCEPICEKQTGYCVDGNIKKYFVSEIWKYILDGFEHEGSDNYYTITGETPIYNLKTYTSEFKVSGFKEEVEYGVIVQKPSYIYQISVDDVPIYSYDGVNKKTIVTFEKEDNSFSNATSNSIVKVSINDYSSDNTNAQVRYYEDIVDIDSSNYIFPYYGGNLTVGWDYTITMIDSCKTPSATTISGNHWEDVIVIVPNEEQGNDGEYNEYEIEYTFRECLGTSISSDTESLTACSESEVQFETHYGGGEDCTCNKFIVSYKQYKTPQSQECDSFIETMQYSNISFEGSTINGTYTCNGIEVVTKPSWISVAINEPTSSITYTVESNEETSETSLSSSRSGMVVFKNKEKECTNNVVFNQNGERCQISCVEPQVYFGRNGGSEEYILNEDCMDFTATTSASWISATIVYGNLENYGKLTITVEPSTQSREGYVSLKNGVCKEIIIVNQTN